MAKKQSVWFHDDNFYHHSIIIIIINKQFLLTRRINQIVNFFYTVSSYNSSRLVNNSRERVFPAGAKKRARIYIIYDVEKRRVTTRSFNKNDVDDDDDDGGRRPTLYVTRWKL